MAVLELVALDDLRRSAPLHRSAPTPGGSGCGCRCSASSWLKRTSCDFVADTRRHGHRHQPEADRTRPDGLRHGGLPVLGRCSQWAYYLRRSWPLPPRSAHRRVGRPRPATTVEVGGPAARLTNLDKVLYPATGFTKGQVIDFYARIGPVMLPHLEDRPRHDGAPPRRHRPASGSSRSAAPGTARSGSTPCRSTPTRRSRRARSTACPRWCGWPTSPRSSCTRPRPAPPTRGADRDRVRPRPGPAGRPPRLRAVSRSSCTTSSTSSGCARSRRRRARRACTCRCGIRPSVDAETTKGFALALGKVLESRDPKRVTVTMAKEQRGGQRVRRLEPERPAQDDGVRVLAARDATRPAVSTPVSWDELTDARRRR